MDPKKRGEILSYRVKEKMRDNEFTSEVDIYEFKKKHKVPRVELNDVMKMMEAKNGSTR